MAECMHGNPLEAWCEKCRGPFSNFSAQVWTYPADLANLRDRIAISAMQGYLAGNDWAFDITYSEVSRRAYLMSDAMLAERAKKEGGK